MAPLIGQCSVSVILLTNQLFVWIYLNSGSDVTKRVPPSEKEREKLSIDVKHDSARWNEKKQTIADDQKCGQLCCPAPYLLSLPFFFFFLVYFYQPFSFSFFHSVSFLFLVLNFLFFIIVLTFLHSFVLSLLFLRHWTTRRKSFLCSPVYLSFLTWKKKHFLISIHFICTPLSQAFSFFLLLLLFFFLNVHQSFWQRFFFFGLHSPFPPPPLFFTRVRKKVQISQRHPFSALF